MSCLTLWVQPFCFTVRATQEPNKFELKDGQSRDGALSAKKGSASPEKAKTPPQKEPEEKAKTPPKEPT